MSAFVDRIRAIFHERKGSRLIFILCAAVLLELVSIVQYYYTQFLLRKEQERLSRVELTTDTDMVLHTLEEAETTMRENEWSVRQSLSCPDSLYGAALRLIQNNPLVAGSCIAVIPDYYPEKGRLFEPYAHKENGRLVVEQIAGPDHDYTQSPDFSLGLQEETEFWGEPYEYGENPVQQLTTYTYPVRDRNGRIAAVCGLDIDLTWLSDSLNAHHYYPSSFGFMLTGDGRLVAGPREENVPKETVAYVMGLMADTTVVRPVRGHNRISYIDFRDPVTGERAYVDYKPLSREPGWVVAQVTYLKDVLAPVKEMMWKILLLSLASLAVLLFIIGRFARNDRRLREADLKQARLGSELQVARRIQEEILPKSLLDSKGLTIKGYLTPAKEVGGDLYDYYVRDGKLFFCIGDVSGKGVPAAMVMAVALSLFRMISNREDDPARMMDELNREACRNNQSGMFVTLFLGVLDLSTGVLRYCNAGHDHPALVRESADELSALANLPVGVFSDYAYQGQETTVVPGSVLFLYTDGVTESKDSGRQLYGKKRLLEVLSDGSREPDALVSRVEADVRSFAAAAEQSDDITMLAIRYDASGVEPELDETLTLSNNHSEVRALGEFIKGVSARLGFEEKATRALQLAVEEAVVNVMDYAYPSGTEEKVTVRARSDGKTLRFTVSDNGVPFDPTAAPTVDTSLPAEKRDIGGLGIYLYRTLMDGYGYERVGGTNVLTLEKNL